MLLDIYYPFLLDSREFHPIHEAAVANLDGHYRTDHFYDDSDWRIKLRIAVF